MEALRCSKISRLFHCVTAALVPARDATREASCRKVVCFRSANLPPPMSEAGYAVRSQQCCTCSRPLRVKKRSSGQLLSSSPLAPPTMSGIGGTASAISEDEPLLAVELQDMRADGVYVAMRA